ncbi:N-acetyltransferase [Sporosarcina sp. P26b]|uniref:GNAT family N-acetyltransferase n=1 Tax=Sporosarcina TaxID=1569 RepID=UPI000A17D697|nr:MULTISPECIES: GNAT family protein [Sporosarcina]ARK20302.1 GNAT family acetyltransferase [Sporosarcina ureae]PIC96823.1 N-acetyltransferase [Sporosarcina sp. P26b]
MKEILLPGVHVTLRPMKKDDVEALYSVAQDDRIWTYMTNPMKTRLDMEKYIQAALRTKDLGSEYPFVIIHNESGKIIGSTRLMDIVLSHKRLEIGNTWLHPEFWQTSVNTECKYLLFTYCFEELQLNRVQLKTDHENIRSQQAIERIGAVKEGVLRNHMIRVDGTIRHTVMFSVTKEQWASVKGSIEDKINYIK